MAHIDPVCLGHNGRNGVGAGSGIQHQGAAGYRRFGVFRALFDLYAAAVGADAAALADGFGIDKGGCIPA